MKRVAFTAFMVLLTLMALGLLWAFRSTVVLLLLSIAVSAAIRPVVDVFMGRGLSLSLAIAVTYAGLIALLGAILYVLGARLFVEVPTALDQIVEAYGQAAESWPSAGGFREFVAGSMPPPEEFHRLISELEAGGFARQAVDTTFSVLNLLGQVLMVIVMAIYWSAGRDEFERLWLSLLPVEHRKRARAAWISARRQVGAALRRELVQSVAAAMVLSIGFRILGCGAWALPAVAIPVLRLIPLVGGALSLVAALIAGWMSGPVQAIGAATLTLAVLVLLRFYVAPRWLRTPEPLNPILTVMVFLALLRAFGLVGVIAAPLVAAAIQSLFTELVAGQAAEFGEPALENVKRRTDRLERRFRRAPPGPALESVLRRLRGLVDRADAD